MNQRVDVARFSPLSRTEEVLLDLRLAGADPWTTEVAMAYMEEERRRMMNIMQRLVDRLPFSHRVGSALLFIFYVVIAILVARITAPDPTGGMVGVLLLFAGAVLTMLTAWNNEWAQYSLDDYLKNGFPWPQRAAALVKKLEEQFPQARYEVWALKRDPVLWIIVDGDKFPILVWDAAGFIVPPPQ